jgi:hypothetical protein
MSKKFKCSECGSVIAVDDYYSLDDTYRYRMCVVCGTIRTHFKVVSEEGENDE